MSAFIGSFAHLFIYSFVRLLFGPLVGPFFLSFTPSFILLVHISSNHSLVPSLNDLFHLEFYFLFVNFPLPIFCCLPVCFFQSTNPLNFFKPM